MAPARIERPITPVREKPTNGVHMTSATSSPATVMNRTASQTFSQTFKSGHTTSRHSFIGESSSLHHVRNVAQSLEKKGIAELGFGVFESFSTTKFIELVEYIGNERLTSLPHRGSTWDKVLIRALYFAERQHGFEKMMKNFGSEDHTAAHLAYGYCKLLLELGHENADALDKAFSVLYKHALDVAALQQRLDVVETTSQIREELSLMYGDLLTLTSVVATRFYKVTHGIASAHTSLDIYEICGGVIESFRERQEKVIELIWQNQAHRDGFDMKTRISAKALKAWLVSLDPVQTALTQDHTVLLSVQAQYTGLWFHKPLSQFVQSESKVMAVTGTTGSGKSVLAASVVERLQRALGRKTFSTLYYAISADTPAATTTISILKSLLAQILNLRIGNMQTYRAVVHAYEHCYYSTDLKSYEEHLWEALDDALKKPLDNARDLIIVVDGLDDIQGGNTAAQSFFERLAEITCDGKKVKLIGLAETLSMPSGIPTTHVAITRENVQEDIHAVTQRALTHSDHFKSKQGYEQEYLLDQIARTANGSFVWAELVSRLLSETKTADEFTKSLDEFEKSKPSVSDLVQKTISKHELPALARTIIGWMVHAERPLTIYELQTLFQHGSKHIHDHDEDVTVALKPLAPILTDSSYIKRFRHRSMQHSVSGLITSGKISIPDDTKHADILIRGLRYAKTVLRENPEPSVDEFDFAIVEQTLREHSLLTYIVRYWTVHLHRMGTKHPKELPSVLPHSTYMSFMERTIFNHELPLIETITLYKLASDIRHANLKEPSPASLQSAINLAVVYDLLEKPSDAGRLYYWCSKTSHRLQYDILCTELSHRYLHVSERFIETKRTEIMTCREEVYIILITLLIKEYGISSEEVVHMRTMLAHFYEHIHEKEHAAEIYELIHEATIHIHGRDSAQARGISDHLTVRLGRTKTDEHVRTREDTIFDEKEEVEVHRHLDIHIVIERLKHCKTEREFVELWQQVSVMARTSMSTEWHEKNIEVAMAYARFLSSQKRTTEASAVLVSVSREYETHQASYSERVISRLTETSSMLREFGQYAAALSILTATSYFFSSMKKEESHQSVEIKRQISTVESELIQHSSTTVHTDVLERVFRNTIQDYSKTIDIKVITLSKTLVSQYVERHETTHAVEIIKLLLERTWRSFFSASTTEVEMTTIFPKETIELIIEYLVPCYLQLRQINHAERSLLALFNAAITAKTVDFVLVNRIQTLLLEHYDKHHTPEKAIHILQRTLSVRRSHHGTTHEETIKILYELGRRSRQRPRVYPGWIDYYQQIVTYLVKDSNEPCPAGALDALVVVCTTYWEDYRYDDAVYYYKILWITFTKQPKQHPRFSHEDFVEQLYERYYMCLEHTSARIETLYQLTKQYRSTCITLFGAQSEVTIRATLALARISYSSHEHSHESLSWYEEVSKHSSVSTYKHEIQTALTTLYTREITETSTSSSSETVESAQSRSLSSYQSSVSKLGYSHESTLSQLHQVALLYFKQSKTESATRELTTATTEIITKETSSRKLIESAESIFVSFQSIKATAYLERMVTEFHRQIVRKESTHSKTWGFDLTKYGRSVLPFLAIMMCKLSTDATISFSETIANLITEMVYFEEYRSLVKSNDSLQAILLSASSLRAFLLRIHYHEAVSSLDEEVASIFVTRDGSKMKLLSKSSARIFMVAIMEYLGTHKNPSFIKAVVVASNEKIVTLMNKEQYAEAYDIANCAFEFASENEGYSGPRGISYGFSLASNLAGIGYTKKCQDANLRKQMLHLSNTIVKKILEICRRQHIKFTEIQLKELNRVVELLGVQEDYETLETLLSELWASREAHRDWDASTLHNLGRDLIRARYLAGHPIKALRLCEDIAYNLRRTHGATNPVTREMNTLLAELYTGTGQHYLQQGSKDKTNADLAHQYFVKALTVHEEMLRLLVNAHAGSLGDDDDWDSTGAILAEHGITLKLQGNGHGEVDEAAAAKTHLRLLKLAYQRLGAWPGSHQEYERLVHDVQGKFSNTKEVSTPEKWQIKGFGGGKAESNDGTFGKVAHWHLVDA